MPFRSQAQRGYMYANHPEIAKRWEDTYGSGKNLPKYAKGQAPKIKRKRRKVKRA
jgi:hypothetical protein